MKKGLPKGSNLGSTKKKFSIENKNDGHNYNNWNHGGTYNFETWLVDARGCTLIPILMVEVPFLGQVQCDEKQEQSLFEEPHKLEMRCVLCGVLLKKNVVMLNL